MKKVDERLAKYFRSTLTVKRPVDIQTVDGKWEKLGRGEYDVAVLDADDRKYVIRAYGSEFVVEEIEIDTMVSSGDADVEDGAMSKSADGYMSGRDDDDQKSGTTTRKTSRARKPAAKKTTTKKPAAKKPAAKKPAAKKPAGKAASSRTTAKKSTPKKSTTRKSSSTRRKKKENVMEPVLVTLSRPTVINETIYPEGTMLEITDPVGQRTFGFGNEPDMVNDSWADPEINDENMEEMLFEKITAISGDFYLSEGGLSAELDKYLGYTDTPDEREVAKAIGFDWFGLDWLDDVLKKVDPEAYELWMQERDPDELFGFGEWLEDNGNGWRAHGADNTYNWNYLGPFDLDFFTIEHDRTYYTFYKVHRGGDIRGNYSRYYVFEGNDETDFLFMLMGSATVLFEFEDGSTWQFNSNNDQDIWDFELNEYEIERNSLAETFKPLLKEFRSIDDAVTEIWYDWENK